MASSESVLSIKSSVNSEPFFEVLEVRKVICTTNTIDGFNSHFEM